jgi:hypothetical protein
MGLQRPSVLAQTESWEIRPRSGSGSRSSQSSTFPRAKQVAFLINHIRDCAALNSHRIEDVYDRYLKSDLKHLKGLVLP